MSRHPADDARRQALLLMVGMAALFWRAGRIYRAAGQARQREREMRSQHARELNDLDEQQLSRMADLQGEIAALKGQLDEQRTITGDRTDPPAAE